MYSDKDQNHLKKGLSHSSNHDVSHIHSSLSFVELYFKEKLSKKQALESKTTLAKRKLASSRPSKIKNNAEASRKSGLQSDDNRDFATSYSKDSLLDGAQDSAARLSVLCVCSSG